MSRCNVCSEKAYVSPCAHCDKKVCEVCKEAHCDILKREITRINNQIKRGWHRLEDCLGQVERNQQQLELNANSVLTEIDEIHRRLTNAISERTNHLKTSVQRYLVAEMKGLKELKSNLDLELTNIQSNADLMEKHLDDDTKWDDNELMDCKEIFIKMMDFIRNYDPGSEEYTRRIRLTTHDAVNDVAKKILEMGDLKLAENKPKEEEDYSSSSSMRPSGLSRSKSDHRLVADFRRREEASERSPPRRRFGESRYSREDNKSRTNFGRFGGDDDDEDDSALGRGGGRFRSRFLRNDDDDYSYGSSSFGGGNGRGRSNYGEEPAEDKAAKKERTKVVETEDASRGPLSGCIRLADSSRIIQRLKVSSLFLSVKIVGNFPTKLCFEKLRCFRDQWRRSIGVHCYSAHPDWLTISFVLCSRFEIIGNKEQIMRPSRIVLPELFCTKSRSISLSAFTKNLTCSGCRVLEDLCHYRDDFKPRKSSPRHLLPSDVAKAVIKFSYGGEKLCELVDLFIAAIEVRAFKKSLRSASRSTYKNDAK